MKTNILIESYNGTKFTDSPKLIYDYLKYNDNYDFTIIATNYDPNEINPENTIVIDKQSPSYPRYIFKADYLIQNSYTIRTQYCRSNSIVIDFWHGTPLKKIGKDALLQREIDNGFFQRVDRVNYYVSPNEHLSKVYREDFLYKHTILEVGYPRNDVFYKSDEEKDQAKKKIKKALNLQTDKKILLYAPTWRWSKKDRSLDTKLAFNQDSFEESLDDYFILYRFHHFENKNKIKMTLNSMDVSSYMHSEDILLIADMLITDYSSVMFDYANSNNPMIFFPYDLDKYLANNRDLYFQYGD